MSRDEQAHCGGERRHRDGHPFGAAQMTDAEAAKRHRLRNRKECSLEAIDLSSLRVEPLNDLELLRYLGRDL
jgi:hypothetical protein